MSGRQQRNCVNADTSRRDLLVDIFHPADPTGTETAVMLIHGGGWRSGNRQMMEPMALALSERGFIAITVEYRLTPEAEWPAPLDDVIAAVRWAASHSAELGVRTDRIALLGASAGAHLALLAASDMPAGAVAAVVSLFAPTELSADDPEQGAVPAAMLFGPGADSARARSASPIHRAMTSYPSTLLIHGGDDWLIHPDASTNFYRALVEAGVAADLHLVAGAHHEFVNEPGMIGPVADEIAWFLLRSVVAPERWRQEAFDSNIFARGREAFEAAMMKDADPVP